MDALPALPEPFAALRDHVLAHAVKRGSFTLKSGAASSWFLDTKQTACRPEGILLVAAAALTVIPDDATAIGGLTMGADPVATAMLHAAAAQGRQVDAFVVRKEAKAHGLQRQVEGPDIAGRRVLVLEDTSTTGGSPLTALQAVRAAGAPLGIADAGYHAIESMRLEKGYRAFGRELTPDYTPVEAGLVFATALAAAVVVMPAAGTPLASSNAVPPPV